MERVRLGVLGAGNIAVMNVRGYLEDPRCDVVAVCDTDEEVGRQAAKEWGAETFYPDLADLLADDSIDAVEVLTPTHLHHDHVIAALDAGKHVSVQKPVANCVEDALEMQAAAERAGRTLRVSECFVHYPPLELAKRLVADGAIGKPTSLRIRTLVGQTDSAFQAALRPEGYGWRLDKRSPGGHLFDDMVHKYAMALWLLDLDIISVQAVVRRRDLFFEPCAVIFEYEDPEVLGMMEVQYSPNFYMRSSYYGADEFFEITGDEGQIWVTRATGEMLDLAPVMLFTGTSQERKTTEFTDIDADWGAGFVRSSQHFVDSLVHGHACRHDRRRGHRRAAPVLRRLRGGRHAHAGRPPRHHQRRQPTRLGGVVGQPAGASQGGRSDLDPPERGLHPAEPAVVGCPLPPRLGHLVTGAGDEVPPHEHGLGEGHAAEDQGAERRVGLERALVAAQAEIGQDARLDDCVPHPYATVEDHKRVLVVGAERDDDRAGALDPQLDAHVRRVAPCRGLGAGEVPDQHGGRAAVDLQAGQLGVVLEGRVAVAGGLGLGHPELDRVQHRAAAGILLGVRHAVAGGHEVELAGPDELLGAEAVEMQQLPRHEPGHRLQAHVGMRPNAELPRRTHHDRAHVVGEAPRANRAAGPLREHAPHGQ